MPENTNRFAVAGLTWHLEPAEESSQVARCLKLGRDPRELKHVVVKANPHRRVLRIELDGSAFYLKQHVCANKTRQLKLLLFPSRAKAEWEALQKMCELGFLTAPPVAYAQGTVESVPTSVIVTRGIEGALNLREALESLEPERAVQLAKGLGAQLRVLHDRGVYHRDMQPGNFFVKPEGGGFLFYFLDLHKAVFCKRVSAGRRVRDIAQLVFNLGTFSDAAVVDALLSGYGGSEPVAEFARRVMRRAPRLRAIRKRSRAKRCLKTSTSFVVEYAGNLRIYRRREIPSAAVQSVVGTYRASGEKVIVVEGFERPCHVKEVESGGVYQNFKDLFQHPRGRRAWHAANALSVRGIPTPRPLALVEELRAGLLKRSYLITEHMESAATLARYVHENCVMKSPEPSQLRILVRELAQALAALHNESIYHSDLKATNILVETRPGGKLCFYFTDLDGVQLWRKPGLSRVVKNLVQLYCSLPSCVARPLAVRFFVRFLRETGLRTALRGRLTEIERKAQARRMRWIATVRKHGKIL